MKKQTKKIVFAIFVVSAVGFFSQGLMAQPILPGGGAPPETALPINGLIAIALIAGAYFGAKKLKGEK